ncbi:MAG: HAMP domain-containing protein [Blastocatellia bacterium]|nr:HAMP domain-containing protein [Blastocatellia bacterium]
MFKLIGSIKIFWKLALIVLVMIIPLGIVLSSYWKEKDTSIDFSQKELYGAQYMGPVKSLLMHAIQHRTAAFLAASGDANRRGELSGIQSSVEADFKSIQDLDEKTEGGEKLGQVLKTSDSLSNLKRSWQSAKDASNGNPTDCYDKNSKFVADTIGLIAQVGDTSNLILDPDLDSYYLMDAVIVRLPDTAEVLSGLYTKGGGVALKKAITPDEKAQFSVGIGRVQANLDAYKRNYGVAYKNTLDTNLQARMDPPLNDAAKSMSGILTTADQRLIKAVQIDVDPGSMLSSGSESLTQVMRFYDESLKNLTDLIQKRVDRNKAQKQTNILIAALGALIALTIAVIFSIAITRQTTAIVTVFDKIDQGNYAARSEVMGTDELGKMATALNTLLDNTVSLIQSRDEKERIQYAIMNLLDEVSKVAEGDLTIDAEVREDITGAIADSFNFMTGELRRVISNVQETTIQVSAAANEVQVTAEHLATGSEAQAAQIVDTSAAIDEMSVSIQQVSENAVLSATVAEQARTNARQGAEVVGKTIQGMGAIRQQVQETAKRIKRLGESSQEIGEIVQLISDIADRTSILALNASIQAAMAGEAGRGFGVVAGEVERLAERSAEATKRISTLIKSVQSETNDAVAAMEETTREVVSGSTLANEAGKALSEIETVSNRLAELIQSISLASKQQARGSEAIARAMADVSEITQQTAAGTKQATVSIKSLAELTENLRSSVSTFKLPS